MIELLLNAHRLYQCHPLAPDVFEYVGHGVRVARPVRHPRAAWPWVDPELLQYRLNPEPSPLVEVPLDEWWRRWTTSRCEELTGAAFLEQMARSPTAKFPLEPCRCGGREIVVGDTTRTVCVCPVKDRAAAPRLQRRYVAVPEAPPVNEDLLLNLYHDGFLECSEDSTVMFSWERPTLARQGALMVSIALPDRFSAALLPTVT